MTGPVLRDAVRAVVLDPADRLVLVRFEFPHGTIWAPPGGGVDPGETDEQALRRELREELGLDGFEIGPLVWTREFLFEPRFGESDGQRERVYVVRTEAFQPTPHLSREQLASEYVFEIRWWTQAELAATNERLAPLALPRLVADLTANGPPAEPPQIGR